MKLKLIDKMLPKQHKEENAIANHYLTERPHPHDVLELLVHIAQRELTCKGKPFPNYIKLQQKRVGIGKSE